MEGFLGFIESENGNYWSASNNNTQLFNTPDARVRWVSTTAGLLAQLDIEDPSSIPGTTNYKASYSSVEKLERPMLPTGISNDTALAAIKLAGDDGLLSATPHDLPDVIWKEAERNGWIGYHNPEKYAAKKKRDASYSKRAEKNPVQLYVIQAVATELKADLLPERDDPTPLSPLRWVFNDGAEAQSSQYPVHRLVGYITILEKFIGKSTVRKHKGVKRLLDQWARNPDGNRQKYTEYGTPGVYLIAWAEEVLKIKAPASTPELATAGS